MHTVEHEEEQHAAELDQEPRTVRLLFKRGPDCRRYNEPAHNEIAAVLVGEDGEIIPTISGGRLRHDGRV